MRATLLIPLLIASAAVTFGEDLEVESRAKPTSHFLSVDGARVHYREVAPALPATQTLLLIHGWIGSSYDFEPLLEHLPRTMRVIAVDLPGSGQSQKSGLPFSLEYFLDFIDSFIRRLDLNDIVLVGHSLGGEFAVRYAVLHPERVRHLVLIAPFGLSGEGRALGFVRKAGFLVDIAFALNNRLAVDMATRINVFHDPTLVTSAYVDSVAETSLTASGRRAQAEITKKVLGRDPIDNLLSLVNAPTLIVWGRNDRVLSLKWAQHFVEGIRNSRLVVIPRTGHMPQFEAPEAVAESMSTFLSGSLQ